MSVLASDFDLFDCHVCGDSSARVLPGFTNLPGVASDARPWGAGARLGSCESCGTLVKDVGPAWQATVDRIYATYRIYHQSLGSEKLSFDGAAPHALPRSRVLLEALFRLTGGSRIERALDIGTGSGVMLKAIAGQSPGTALWGQDLSADEQPTLERIPGFKGLYTQPVESIEEHFDLLTLVHVLEHVPDPVAFLRHARERLRPGGHLVVNVPDAAVNPVDLLVTDHCTHLTLDSLVRLVSAAGLEPVLVSDALLGKELVVVCRVGPMQGVTSAPTVSGRWQTVYEQVAWLSAVLEQGRELLDDTSNGLFGASLAGAWLGGTMPRWRGPFVDEDPSRIGNRLLGRPIIAPEAVPPGTTVYVPLAPQLAGRIVGRLMSRSTPYVAPAPLPR